MKKEKALFILGLWVAILGALGIPMIVKKILFVLTGLAIMYIAYFFYKQAKNSIKKDENSAHSFIENNINN
jgi:uncharacterized membrane protein YuzA (DUF378 family)